jgi:hypothetical protein
MCNPHPLIYCDIFREAQIPQSGVVYRPDVRFFAPVTDDHQALCFEILVKIAASREDPEV